MGIAAQINSPVAPAFVAPLKVASVTRVSAPAAKTATFSSTAIDLLTSTGVEQAKLVLDTGTVSGTTPTMDVIIEESTDNSTFTTVVLDADSPAFAQVVATGIQVVKFKRTKRYLRITGTIAGTTPSFTVGATLLR